MACVCKLSFVRFLCPSNRTTVAKQRLRALPTFLPENQIARYGDGFRRVISVKLGEQPSRGGRTDEERDSLLRRLLRLQTAQSKDDSLDRILDALFFNLLVDFCFRSSLLWEIVHTYENPSFARRISHREHARDSSTDESAIRQVRQSGASSKIGTPTPRRLTETVLPRMGSANRIEGVRQR